MAVTLIVEDGSTVAGANTYTSLADAFAYHSNLGNSDFTNRAADYASFIAGDTSAQAQALVQATMLIDLLYAELYIGYPGSPAQSLLWPRIPTIYGTPYTYDYVGFQSYLGLRDAYGLYRSTTTIPPELRKAVCQGALQIINGDTLIPTQLDPNANLAESLTMIGDIKTQARYFGPTSTSKTHLLNRILYPILTRGQLMLRG